jgi:hypothetical protein
MKTTVSIAGFLLVLMLQGLSFGQAEKWSRSRDSVEAPVAYRMAPIKAADASVRAKIMIPKKMWEKVRQGDMLIGNHDSGPSDAKPVEPYWFSIVAGLAMALAVTSALFVFRGRKTNKPAIAFVAGSLLVGLLAICEADVVPSRHLPKTQPPINNSPPKQAAQNGDQPKKVEKNKVIIEFTDSDSEFITLLVAD